MKGIFLIGLFYFCLPWSGRAGTLTWSESIDLARNRHAELKAADDKLEAVQFQEGVVQADFFPRISADLDVQRNRQTPSGGQSVSRHSLSLKSSWNLFSGFKDRERFREARSKTRAESASLQILKAKVSFELKTNFQGFLYARNYESLTQEIKRRREENLRLVELRFESGRENKGSVVLSRAYLRQANYDYLQAQNTLRVAKAELAKTLGLDDFPYEGVAGSVPIRDPEKERPDFRELALQSPEFRQSSFQEEGARSAIQVARAGFYPSLDLSGSLDQGGRRFFPDEHHSWTIKLGLSFPLFNGGSDHYQVKSATASWSAAKNSQEQMKRALWAKFEQTYAGYEESVEKLKMNEGFLEAAVIRAEISRNKYNNGLLEFEDWDIIENDLISKQKLLLQSQLDRVKAEALWEQVQGTGIFP